MTLDDALRALAATGNELPRDALRWTLDHWDEAGPRLVGMLDAYARGEDRSESTERALFFAVHLLGEEGETAAFAPLCRLLLDGEASDLVFGDAVTETVPRILVSTYDGNLAALTGVIEAAGAEEFVRERALVAMAYLARTGRIAEAEMRAALLRWVTELQPQGEAMVWVGWVVAAACLGYADLAGSAEELMRRGFVPSDVTDMTLFRQDLKRTQDDPAGLAGFVHERMGPFGSVIEEMEGSHSFSGEEDEPGSDDFEVLEPYVNPLRNVGRNDPCPCGSGKKYKKCCLVA